MERKHVSSARTDNSATLDKEDRGLVGEEGEEGEEEEAWRQLEIKSDRRNMALSQVSACLALSLPNSGAMKLARVTNASSTCRVHVPQLAGSRSTFASGSPLLPLSLRMTRRGAKSGNRGASVSIRSEQSTDGSSGLDIWLGRGAMIGFAVAITVEVATGKGLLENFGVASPLPTVALAVTALVGVLTAVFIFQSSSKN